MSDKHFETKISEVSSSMSFTVENNSENLVTESSILKSCQTCGRTFNPKSLERHEKICEKTKKSNHRTVFNSFLQRGKEIGAVLAPPDTKDKESSKSKRKCREQESLMRVVRLGKNFNPHLLNNGLSPQKNVPPGYQQCPSCERHFSEKAADRHISWCQEQRNRLPKTPNNTEALERLKARVKYRAPLPGTSRNLENLNQRLVKSAESVRESSSSLRTHSSPSIPCNTRTTGQGLEKKANRNRSNENELMSRSKKAVKFKEMFPVYDKDRNRNLDMLAALRLRLSELSAADDLVEDYIRRSESNSPLSSSSSKNPSKESWSSGANSSSTPESLPPLPRYCYNCGTKYPLLTAKYCCECGTQRFPFGAMADTRLSLP